MLLCRLTATLAGGMPGTSSSSGAVAVVSSSLLEQRRGRRRTLVPPPWIPRPVDANFLKSRLTAGNQALLKKVVELERSRPVLKAPRQAELPPPDDTYTAETRRVGLVARKLGMMPQWLSDGTRILCTLLHVAENAVVSTVSPDDWFRRSLIGKHKAFNRDGPMWKVTVGAVDADPHQLTTAWRRQFERAGVPPKAKLAAFLVTENALVAPGTPLGVEHFVVGQRITASGRTIDWGFQGAMHRWGFRGMPAHGPTKSHRRVGSTGAKGDARVWPGKRMPGHMGYEWVHSGGLEVVRINYTDQVIYVRGCTPGDVGEWNLLKDCRTLHKTKIPDVPMPTHLYESGTAPRRLETIREEEEEERDDDVLRELERRYAETKSLSPEEVARLWSPPREAFAEKLHRFLAPSVTFAALDEKASTRVRGQAKLAKAKT